jgi:hypothetical protein
VIGRKGENKRGKEGKGKGKREGRKEGCDGRKGSKE